MTDSYPQSAGQTARSASEEIERICDAFEAAWKEARRDGRELPDLGVFLADSSPSVRSRLMRELLLLDLEYRELEGAPSLKVYLHRWPDDGDLIRDAFQYYSQNTTPPMSDGESLAATSRLRLVKLHREGGLGQIWMGRDESIGRPVAVKEIRPAYTQHAEIQTRLVQEAELAGQLEHPGIVPVYALGRRPDGRPFYAMRLIRGISLAEAIKRFHETDAGEREKFQRLELHKLLRRFVDVCNAIAYAHSRGIVHRDLKPDNIMLGKYGETIVVDWGLAKTSAEDIPSEIPEDSFTISATVVKDSVPTQPGMAMGTPAFMSPEQAGQLSGATSIPTDVFGLGATLYCILTGVPPYSGRDLRQTIERAKKGDLVRPRRLNLRTPRKLEAICLKAMAWKPTERYPSARSLGEDVERWLADEPIAALPDSFRDRLWRWARRNRTWVSALMLVLTFVTAGSVAGTFVVNALRLRTQEARDETERQLARAKRALYATQIARADRHAANDPSICIELLNDPAASPKELRDFTWHYLYRLCRRDRVAWMAPGVNVRLAAFTHDPDRVVSVSADGAVRLWDTQASLLQTNIDVAQPVIAAQMSRNRNRLALACADGSIRVLDCQREFRATVLPAEPTRVLQLAFSRDGRYLAALHRGDDSPIVVWDVPAARIAARFQGPAMTMSLAISADGTLLAAGGLLHSTSPDCLMLWDISQKTQIPCPQPFMDEEIASLHSLRISSLSFSDDKRLLFAGSELGVLARINLDQGTCRQRWGHSGTIWTIEPGPRESPVIFTAGVGTEFRPGIHAPFRPVVLWDANALEPLTAMAGISSEAVGLDFNKETGQLLVTQQDGVVLLLDCTEQWIHTDLAQGAPVDAVAFSDNGRVIVAAGVDNRSGRIVLRHWDPYTGQPIAAPKIESPSGLLVMPSGHILPKNRTPPQGQRKAEELVAASTGKVLGRLTLEEAEAVAAVCSNHVFAAVSAPNDTLKIWDIHSMTIVAMLHAGADMGADALVVFSSATPAVAWGSTAHHGRIEIWDLSSTARIGSMDDIGGGVSTMAFSPCGNALAVGHRKADLRAPGLRQVHPASVTMFRLPSCEAYATMKAHAGDVCSLAFSPDGRTLCTGSLDWRVRLWDTASAVQMATLEHHANSVFSVAFAPDGQTLASAGADRSIRLWHAATPSFVNDREAWNHVQLLSQHLHEGDDRLAHLQENQVVPEPARLRALEWLGGSGMILLDGNAPSQDSLE